LGYGEANLKVDLGYGETTSKFYFGYGEANLKVDLGYGETTLKLHFGEL
jgi:hypothetical protein